MEQIVPGNSSVTPKEEKLSVLKKAPREEPGIPWGMAVKPFCGAPGRLKGFCYSLFGNSRGVSSSIMSAANSRCSQGKIFSASSVSRIDQLPDYSKKSGSMPTNSCSHKYIHIHMLAYLHTHTHTHP